MSRQEFPSGGSHAPGERRYLAAEGPPCVNGNARAGRHLPGDDDSTRAVAENDAELAAERQNVLGARASGRRMSTASRAFCQLGFYRSLYSAVSKRLHRQMCFLFTSSFSTFSLHSNCIFPRVPQGSRFDYWIIQDTQSADR